MDDDASVVERFMADYDNHFNSLKDNKHYYAVSSTFFTFNIDEKIIHHKHKLESIAPDPNKASFSGLFNRGRRNLEANTDMS